MNIAVVTGATSMIGLAAVKELVKNNVKVYAVVREASPNIDRLKGIDNIEIVNCSLDSLLTVMCFTTLHGGIPVQREMIIYDTKLRI